MRNCVIGATPLLDTGKQVCWQSVKTQMPLKAAFNQGLHCILQLNQSSSETEIYKKIRNLEILTCKPIKYKIDKQAWIQEVLFGGVQN